MPPQTGFINDQTNASVTANTIASRNNLNDWTVAAAGNPNPNNASGTDPYTGFSAQFQPGSLRNVIYDNPWSVLPYVFEGMGQNTPGYQNLRDIGADPLTLYNIMQGAYSGMTQFNEGDYANWLAQVYGNLGQVGGRSFNSRELLGSIANAREGSALRAALEAGDTSTQVRTLYNLASEAMNAGMNPLAARAQQARMAQAGDRYMSQSIGENANEGANSMTFDKWLLQNMPGLLGR
jgi:hypothetical protein